MGEREVWREGEKERGCQSWRSLWFLRKRRRRRKEGGRKERCGAGKGSRKGRRRNKRN